MATNNDNTLLVGNLVFKLKFLKTMLPVMNLDDANFYSLFVMAFYNGEVSEEDIKRLEELYGKFEERKPDAQVPKT